MTPKQSVRSTYPLLVIGLVFILALGGCTALPFSSDTAAPPPGYQTLAQVDLSTQAHDEQTVGRFTLQEEADIGILFALQNVDSPYFDLRLHTEDDVSFMILHSEALRTDSRGGGLWERSLEPGMYRLVLTAEQSPGTLALAWGQQ